MNSLETKGISVPGFEKTVRVECPEVGLRAIISIHSTRLGPACGGIRLYPYKNWDEALDDVLRLSKGMSYKSSLAGIDFGGGKSVILADPKDKRPELFHAFGEAVNALKGEYIAAQDMNIEGKDLSEVKKKTRHVLGIEGEKGSSGDPSPVTARGVWRAIEATSEILFGKRSLDGVHIALQGIGSVGFALGHHLKGAGARLTVADVSPKAAERAEALGATLVSPDTIHTTECDIFSPGARGGVLNSKTIPELRCKAVVGCANNQLATEEDGYAIHRRGILYAPDFAVNAGGIINVFAEHARLSPTEALAQADRIYNTVKKIISLSKERGTPTFLIANEIAEERIRTGR